MLDQPFSLTAISKTVLLASKDVVWLLKRASAGLVLLVLVFQKAPFEGLCGVEVNFLSHACLLVLEHFFSRVAYQAKLMHVYLNFVLVILEGSKDSQGVSNSDLIVAQPLADLRLALAGLPTMISIIIEPEDASHHTR